MVANLIDQDTKRLSRRVEKVRDLFNTLPANDAGNSGVCTAPPVEKVGERFNKLEVYATTRAVGITE